MTAKEKRDHWQGRIEMAKAIIEDNLASQQKWDNTTIQSAKAIIVEARAELASLGIF